MCLCIDSWSQYTMTCHRNQSVTYMLCNYMFCWFFNLSATNANKKSDVNRFPVDTVCIYPTSYFNTRTLNLLTFSTYRNISVWKLRGLHKRNIFNTTITGEKAFSKASTIKDCICIKAVQWILVKLRGFHCETVFFFSLPEWSKEERKLWMTVAPTLSWRESSPTITLSLRGFQLMKVPEG